MTHNFNRKADKKRREKQEILKARKNEKRSKKLDVLHTMSKHLSTDRNGDPK